MYLRVVILTACFSTLVAPASWAKAGFLRESLALITDEPTWELTRYKTPDGRGGEYVIREYTHGLHLTDLTETVGENEIAEAGLEVGHGWASERFEKLYPRYRKILDEIGEAERVLNPDATFWNIYRDGEHVGTFKAIHARAGDRTPFKMMFPDDWKPEHSYVQISFLNTKARHVLWPYFRYLAEQDIERRMRILPGQSAPTHILFYSPENNVDMYLGWGFHRMMKTDGKALEIEGEPEADGYVPRLVAIWATLEEFKNMPRNLEDNPTQKRLNEHGLTVQARGNVGKSFVIGRESRPLPPELVGLSDRDPIPDPARREVIPFEEFPKRHLGPNFKLPLPSEIENGMTRHRFVELMNLLHRSDPLGSRESEWPFFAAAMDRYARKFGYENRHQAFRAPRSWGAFKPAAELNGLGREGWAKKVFRHIHRGVEALRPRVTR